MLDDDHCYCCEDGQLAHMLGLRMFACSRAPCCCSSGTMRGAGSISAGERNADQSNVVAAAGFEPATFWLIRLAPLHAICYCSGMNPKAVGELSEAIILAHLMRKGWSVSLPFGNNQRYDMLVDTGDKIMRAQCKTGRWLNGCVEFASSSKNGFTGVRTSYAGQIDVFLVYSPKTEAVYMFPADLAGPTFVRLRVDPNKGGATSTIRWAEHYAV